MGEDEEDHSHICAADDPPTLPPHTPYRHTNIHMPTSHTTNPNDIVLLPSPHTHKPKPTTTTDVHRTHHAKTHMIPFSWCKTQINAHKHTKTHITQIIRNLLFGCRAHTHGHMHKYKHLQKHTSCKFTRKLALLLAPLHIHVHRGTHTCTQAHIAPIHV